MAELMAKIWWELDAFNRKQKFGSWGRKKKKQISGGITRICLKGGFYSIN